MPTSNTPFSFPATPSLNGGGDASLFSPWPMLGMETPMSDPNFTFPLPTTPMNLTGTTPECTTPGAAAAAFGYSNFGGMNAFYSNLPTTFCSCADCVGKNSVDTVNVSNSYSGLYSSDESASTMQKSGSSSGSHQKDENNRAMNPASQYPSTDSNELDTESQFDLPYFCATGANNGNNQEKNSSGKESFNLTPPSSEKKAVEQSNDGASIDSQASKIVQQKAAYQTENRAAFNGLTHENIDYYASMNSFPNNGSNATTLFPNYNRAAIGAGDTGSMGFRSSSDQAQQTAATSANSSHHDNSLHQAPVMMYNNTSSYALPYMSWSQGEPLMMPTVFNQNPTSNTSIEATAFPAGMQPIQAPPPTGNQNLFANAAKERPPHGHDEHNPDYANCFPSSNPNVVTNSAHESY